MQGLRSVFGDKMIKSWDNLYVETDAYTDNWLSSGKLPSINTYNLSFHVHSQYIK